MTRNNYNLLPPKKTGHSLQKWKVPKFARLNQIMLTYRISKFSRVQGCLSKIPNLNMHRRVMFVKKVQLISVLLYIINFLIIQPSLVLCEESVLKIFGIKVGVVKHDNDLTSGQKIGYTILNWVLSGLAAIAIILVLLFFCCIAACFSKCC